MKRWDKGLAGKKCQACDGTGSVYESQDLHKSGGLVPCPAGYFRGHGYPLCNEGKLYFSEYDLSNWSDLKKKYKECSPSKVKAYKGIRKPTCGGDGNGCQKCREKYNEVNRLNETNKFRSLFKFTKI